MEREELLETVFYLSRDLLFHVGLRSLARIFMADFFSGTPSVYGKAREIRSGV